MEMELHGGAMEDKFRVPKDKAKVTIHFRNQEALSGEVFLSSYSGSHEGHERVSDLLEGDKEYIPLIVSEDGHSELLKKHNIVMLESNFHDDDESVDEKITIGLIHTYHVKVIFEGGDDITGTVLAELIRTRRDFPIV